MTSMEEFVVNMRQLIDMERNAEIEETKLLQENIPAKELERRGVCLLRLVIASRHVGLYGRTVLQFEASKDLPSHSFTPGDIVGISLSSSTGLSELIASGVVSRITLTSVSVACDGQHDVLLELDDSSHYKLVKLANDVTYRRLLRVLDLLDSQHGNNHLVNVMFGLSEIHEPICIQELQYYNQGLDDSQKDAVRFALSQHDVAIIHGPPGTGKTTTVTELILQAVRMGLKVLACAPSNIAVDNLVEKLAANGATRIVRLGHPARLLPTIQHFSLDAIVSASDETKLVEDVRKDISKALSLLRQTRGQGERRHIRDDMKSLRRELRQRESSAVSDIIRRATVVLSTLTTASDDGPLGVLDQHKFDIVVIDECSQALEVACWIALLRGSRCILAGDHKQLPPTIISERASNEGLSLTLMERLLSGTSAHKLVRMLTVQYRMHMSIMNWSSHLMYHDQLIAHSSVAEHLLRDLPNVVDAEDTCIPLLLIDTAGCNLNELDVACNESKGNEGEANITAMYVENLISSGVSQDDVAVISPYNLQVELLRIRLLHRYPRLEVKSVDGFQGREKEAVVISLVRSNTNREVGFLAEDRRINVAVTRARRHLAVICDSDTVSNHSFIKSLVDHIIDCGEVRSAEQYLQDGAEDSNIRLPEELELRLKFTSPAVMTNKVQKRNVTASEQVCRQKDSDVGQKNITQSTHASDKLIMSREHFAKILSEFASDSSKTVLEFPSTLNSCERYLIHEVSEQLGLLHISKGEGCARHIEVLKQVSKLLVETDNSMTSNTLSSDVNITDIHSSRNINNNDVTSSQLKNYILDVESTEMLHLDDHSDSSRQSSESAVSSTDTSQHVGSNNLSETADLLHKTSSTVSTLCCSNCARQIPQVNYQLHLLNCKSSASKSSSKKSKEKSSDKNVGSQKSSSATPWQNSRKGSARLKSALDNVDEDDFDALVASAAHCDKRCQAGGCKASTAMLGQTCPYCRRVFCLTHHVAEAHGCGDEARRQARAAIARDGVVRPGSGQPSHRPDPAQRAQLETKLAGRLDELASQRSRKRKDGTDKKRK